MIVLIRTGFRTLKILPEIAAGIPLSVRKAINTESNSTSSLPERMKDTAITTIY